MKRLDIKLDTLLSEQKLKTKWSELECHGASEFLSLLFQDQVQYGKLAHAIIIENHVVCMNLYEGVRYMSNGVSEMITKMYIDIEDNIVLLSRSGNIYLYETEAMDASDLRHYYGKD
jgi:hypothetical protein